ncbi:MAG: hypothetical protein KF872_09945 [Chitinophagales bacterium]|nr:hypothetical protein [Chitinophagales bacterium]
MANENVFVFVVCGGKEHIDTLHFSLAALKKYSASKIVVLTDSARNETPVIHDAVIDVKTPENFSHHQASIYLKTGIHKFLPKGNMYCYLDTDVVALNNKVDAVFNHFKAPIVFAPDHCLSNQFSPEALNCGCKERFKEWETELNGLLERYEKQKRKPENLEKKEQLKQLLADIKEQKLRYQWISFKFNLSKQKFKLHNDAFFLKGEGVWVDKEGEPILYEKRMPDIEEVSPYRKYGSVPHVWKRDGIDVYDHPQCNHLHDAIKEQFGIEVADRHWQHWNGGVFLFNDESADFLERWHKKTIEIFSLPYWRVRDQGTLIATVWELSLQTHAMLPRQFNLIVDYSKKDTQHLGNLRFNVSAEEDEIEPCFIHVYHHWADHEWDVWQAIEAHTGLSVEAPPATVHGLWIGNKLSPLELLTIHSFIAKGHEFKLWVYEPLQNTLPNGLQLGDANEIIPKEKVFSYKHKSQFGHGKGSVAGFSDIFRYKLLFDKGGWWVDMDISCLKPFETDAPYFFRKHHNLNVVGNVMKCPKGSLLMKLCYEEALSEVDEHNTDWHKPIDILNRNIERLHLSGYIVENCSNQDRWDDTGRFVFGMEVIPQEWRFIHWQNEEWRSQQLDKYNFYHNSQLAKLLESYGLFTIPTSAFKKKLNELVFHSLVRKAKRNFFRVFQKLEL